MIDALGRFSAATRAWFQGTFAAPTAAQEQGWAAIAQSEHTLILAPTGSGKTLAAFLWCLDQLATQSTPLDPKQRCRVVYVSPLKALAHDVERNLKAPLVPSSALACRPRSGRSTRSAVSSAGWTGRSRWLMLASANAWSSKWSSR